MHNALTNMQAVVTGAAQGLGRGMAKMLAEQGAAVTIADIQIEKAQAAAADLESAGLNVNAGHLDVTDSAAVDQFFTNYLETNGRLDILVNNAGLGQSVTPIVELSDEEWRRVLA